MAAGTCAAQSNVPAAQQWPNLFGRLPTYEELGAAQGRLVTEKQAAYGDSFGKAGQIMRVLYPAGISLDKLEDALTIVRVIDKLFRIATDRDALGESPWKDINGYSLLAMKRLEDQKAAAGQLTSSK